MTAQCGRFSGSGPGSQSGYIEVLTYEAMTPLCGKSVVQVLAIRVDIGVVYNTPEWEASGSGPGCQSGYRSGDL